MSEFDVRATIRKCRTAEECERLITADRPSEAGEDQWDLVCATAYFRLALHEFRELALHATDPRVKARSLRYAAYLSGRYKEVGPNSWEMILGEDLFEK